MYITLTTLKIIQRFNAFLLSAFATQNRVLDNDLANLLIVVVVLTMIATPLLNFDLVA